MKKLLILLILSLTVSVFAVEYNFYDWQRVARTSFEAELAYLNSVDSGDMQIAIAQKIKCLSIRVWQEKNLSQTVKENFNLQGKQLFEANINSLKDEDKLFFGKRFKKFDIALNAFNNLKESNKFFATAIIENTLYFYNIGIINKDIAINNLIFASKKDFRSFEFKKLTKLVDSIPLRDKTGDEFMTREQKKEFYENFIKFNKVTKDSADFLGAVVTQYNLVK